MILVCAVLPFVLFLTSEDIVHLIRWDLLRYNWSPWPLWAVFGGYWQTQTAIFITNLMIAAVELPVLRELHQRDRKF